jgi:excisionase family DNA binding protein
MTQVHGFARRIAASDAPPLPRKFYSVSEVAEMFGMSPMTVYRAIAAGEFPAVKIRGRLIVPARAVEAMADVATDEQTVVDATGWVTQAPGRGDV